MAEIPSSKNINRPTPRAGGTASFTPTLVPNIYGRANIQAPQAAPSGLEEVGEFLVGAGEQLEAEQKKRKDARDKQEIATAKVEWAKRRMAIEKSFIGDDDPATLPQRQNELLLAAREEVLGFVSDPVNQTALGMDFDLDVVEEDLRASQIAQNRLDELNLVSIAQNKEAAYGQAINGRTEEERAEGIKLWNSLEESTVNYGGTPLQVQKNKSAFNKDIKASRHDNYVNGLYQAGEANPNQSLIDFKENTGGMDRKEKASYKTYLNNMVDKQGEALERQALALDFIEYETEHEKFSTNFPTGNYDITDYNAFVAKNGESEFSSYMLDLLTKPDAPSPPVAEQNAIWAELDEEFRAFEISKTGASSANIRELKTFKEKVAKYGKSQHIEPGEFNRFMGGATFASLKAAATGKYNIPNSPSTWGPSPGIQSPYSTIHKVIKEHAKKVGREKDASYIRKVTDAVLGEFLGTETKYISSGDSDKDRERIQKAIADTIGVIESSDILDVTGDNISPPEPEYTFDTMEEYNAFRTPEGRTLPAGTVVIIDGREAVVN